MESGCKGGKNLWKKTLESITKQNRGMGSYANRKRETECMDNDEMRKKLWMRKCM